ncbi:MAG TPA: glycosyltransferase [Trueperaceae bacterium]
MNIAMISEHASPLAALGGADSGGQNVYVAQVASELGRRGNRVVVFTRRDDPGLPDELDCGDNVRLVHVEAGPPRPVRKEELLPFMAEFRRNVSAWLDGSPIDFDLVHAHFFMSGLVADELREARGLPYVITFHALGKVRRRHQGTADTFPDERFEIEERVARNAAAVIAECDQDFHDLQGLYGAPAERIRTVPCGFSTREFGPLPQAQARQRLSLPTDEPVILQLGRMVRRKGVEEVIRGLSRLVHDYRQRALLVVVGGESPEPDPVRTPELGRLMGIAREEGVEELVRFEGQRDRRHLRDYYCAADVFVSTPWYEPFGITPLEAMACGVPVLGSAVGGLKSTVVDGETGFLVPPRNPEAIAERLAVMLREPKILARMRERALARAGEYTWQRVTDLLEDVYEEALGRSALPVPAIVASRDRVPGGTFRAAASPTIAATIPVTSSRDASEPEGGSR